MHHPIKIARECLRSDVKVHALHLVHNYIIIFIAARSSTRFSIVLWQPPPSPHDSTTLLSDIIDYLRTLGVPAVHRAKVHLAITRVDLAVCSQLCIVNCTYEVIT